MKTRVPSKEQHILADYKSRYTISTITALVSSILQQHSNLLFRGSIFLPSSVFVRITCTGYLYAAHFMRIGFYNCSTLENIKSTLEVLLK